MFQTKGNTCPSKKDYLARLKAVANKINKGDYVGHPFRGNQWTKVGAGSARKAPVVTRQYKTKLGMLIDHSLPSPEDLKALGFVGSDYDSAMESAQKIFDVEIDTKLGTIEVEVDSVGNPFDTSPEVSGVITNNGEVIGSFMRRVDLESASVYNASLKLNKEYQGSGIGTTIMAHWEDQYARAGIKEMTTLAYSTGSDVHPNMKMNGAYTWAKYGYKPKSEESVRALFEDFDTALVTKGRQDTARWSAYESIKQKLMVGDDVSFSDALSIKYGKNILKAMDELPMFKDFLKGEVTSIYVEGIQWYGTKKPKIISKASESVEDVINRWMRENPVGFENDDPAFWEEIRRVID
jgi:hypothetical protein